MAFKRSAVRSRLAPPDKPGSRIEKSLAPAGLFLCNPPGLPDICNTPTLLRLRSGLAWSGPRLPVRHRLFGRWDSAGGAHISGQERDQQFPSFAQCGTPGRKGADDQNR